MPASRRCAWSRRAWRRARSAGRSPGRHARSAARRWPSSRYESRRGRDPLPEPAHPAVRRDAARSSRRSRSGRGTSASTRPRSSNASSRHWRRSGSPTSPSAIRSDCPAARRSWWSSRRCWRSSRSCSSSTNRRASSTRPGRGSSAMRCASSPPTGTAVLVVEHKTELLDGLRTGWSSSMAAGSSLDGRPRRVLADPRLEASGRRAAVARPARPQALDRAAALDPAAAAGRRSAAGPPVALEGVGFVYPDGTRALDGVDLAIASGERSPIVGQNGSGKSTLVRQLNGLLRPIAGSVCIHGARSATGASRRWPARSASCSRTPTGRSSPGTVRDEVAFGARNLGRRGPELDAAVEGGPRGGRAARRRSPRTRTTWAIRSASCWRWRRSCRWARRS